MATVPLEIDIDALIAPIDSGSPVGTDLRADITPASLYFQLKDVRAKAREAERAAETMGHGTGATAAQWDLVKNLAVEALQTRSKDLEIAAWLTEVLVRRAGLRGIGAGATILAELIDRYWDNLFPLPDEDGMETRVAPVAGLSGQGADGTLMQPLRTIALFEREGKAVLWWDYEQTAALDAIADPAQRAQRIAAGVMDHDTFEASARAAGETTWIRLRHEVTSAQTAWSALEKVLTERAAEASPSMERVSALLSRILRLIDTLAPSEATATGNEMELPETSPTMSAPGAQPALVTSHKAISGREQALSQLSEIATWFKRNEPHSPLAYTLEEAVRRARLTLPELLEEIMPDETGRHAFLSSLGIRPVTSSSE